MSQPIDMQQCEHCDKEFPIQTMSIMEDNWFCEACIAAWRETFAACQHEWSPEPYYDCMGDKGRFCNRCSGFVADEDAEALGL